MKNKKFRALSFADAINEAQIQAMQLDKNVFILGQGVEKGAMVFNTNKNIEKNLVRKEFLIPQILNKQKRHLQLEQQMQV